MSDRYCILLSFSNILFNIGPLCTGLISAWFNWAGSKHSLTLPLALGTATKLLHHSNTSSTPRGVIISWHCSLSSSSWNGFYSTYVTCCGGAWYSLLFVFSCKENMPLMQPIPLKTSSNSLCICCVDSALFLLLLSQLEPAINQCVGLSGLFLTLPFYHCCKILKCCQCLYSTSPFLLFLALCQTLDSFHVCVTLLVFATSASTELMFMLINLNTSVSGRSSNACPFPGTTKN